MEGSNKLSEAAAISRERHWEEAEASDKIERLRDEVARLCNVVQQQAQIIVKLGGHSHDQTGKLMVPLTESLDNRPDGLFAHDRGVPHRLRRERDRR